MTIGRIFRGVLKLAAPLTVCAVAAGIAPQAQTRSELALKAAMDKEVVDGDLKGAIDEYKKVVANAGADRAIAAAALIHMAECYQKLGDAQARTIFERVVRDYADQSDAVKAATARLGAAPAGRTTGMTTRQVWTGRDVDTYGSVSPDGRVVSFTDWETGDLALHDVTTGQNRRLTNKKDWKDPAFALGSAISRDGRRIAYGWQLVSPAVQAADHFAEVRMIDIDGGTPRVLVANRDLEDVYVHDWSPDGRWLAVQMRRTDHTAQVALVSTTDGAVRILKAGDWGGGTRLAFSPDGRYVAYDRAANAASGPRDIHVIAVDGSGDRPAVAHPANDRVLGWSPDGKYLLFASDRSGSSGMWALPVHEGTPHGEPELIRANFNPRPLGLTRSGALYYGLDAEVHIFVASADFETGKQLSPPKIIPKPDFGGVGFPSWSPDGKSLAYLARRDANSRTTQMTDVLIRSMETGSVRELRTGLQDLNADYTCPVWTPDGSFLLVTAADKDGRRGIYRIDSLRGAASPVVIGEQGEMVRLRALSPDGRTLFLLRRDLKSDEDGLVARDIASGQERVLLRRKGDWGRGADLSPDGRTIAIGVRDPSGSTTTWLVPVDGGEPRALLRASPPEAIIGSLVKWSRDGKSLLIGKRKGDRSPTELWRVSAADGSAHKVDLNPDWAPFLAVNGRQATSFHPDGRQVAFVMGKSELEVWALENFLPSAAARK